MHEACQRRAAGRDAAPTRRHSPRFSDRVEAIKVLLPELTNVPELADRFLREIKVLATLEHPHIAALRTAQRIDNQLVMVMELVEGVTVEEKLKNGPLPVDQAVDIIAQVLSALNYAHARGVIHRDIKPANMMVTEGGVVKLMDFGIAKAAGDRKLTMTGTTLGSLFYMSPEQIKGVDLDPRSDLYSLGVSLYEMVTGARPFKGDSDFSIMSAHLETPPVPPVEVDPRLPAALNEIILMSIVKDPAKRFQSATAFGAAIASVGGHVPAPSRGQAATDEGGGSRSVRARDGSAAQRFQPSRAVYGSGGGSACAGFGGGCHPGPQVAAHTSRGEPRLHAAGIAPGGVHRAAARAVAARAD